SKDGTVRLWQLPNGRLLQTLPLDGALGQMNNQVDNQFFNQPERVAQLLWQDARWIGGTLGGTLVVGAAAPLAIQQASQAHRDGISAIALSPDRRWLATGSTDGTLKLWHWPTVTAQHQLSHGWSLSAIAFTPDGQHLISGSRDGTIEVWQIQFSVTNLP
ncbi:MAG: hypothetical protein AAF728_12750, partial [Cyanobacteria bacterium P01_D01_bin.128]